MKFEELSLETPEQEAIRLGGNAKKDVSNAEVVAENVTKENLELNQEMPATKIESPVVAKETTAIEKDINVLKSEQQADDMRKETAVIEKIANHGQEKTETTQRLNESSEQKKALSPGEVLAQETPDYARACLSNNALDYSRRKGNDVSSAEFLSLIRQGKTTRKGLPDLLGVCKQIAIEEVFNEVIGDKLTEDEKKKSSESTQKLEEKLRVMSARLWETQLVTPETVELIKTLTLAEARKSAEGTPDRSGIFRRPFGKERLNGAITAEDARQKKEYVAKKGKIPTALGVAATAGSTLMYGSLLAAGASSAALAAPFVLGGMGIMAAGYGIRKMYQGRKAKEQSLAAFSWGREIGW